MADNIRECLDALLELDAVRGAAVVDSIGPNVLDIVVADDGPRHQFESRMAVDSAAFLHQISLLCTSGCRSKIENLIFMRAKTIAILVPLGTHPFVFIYLVIARGSNLARALLRLAEIEELLVIEEETTASWDGPSVETRPAAIAAF